MRQCFETMNQALADARREGLMVTGELARFYCMGVCDGFFFTDWAGDRLTNGNVHQASCGDHGPVGEPVPLFELVFHECFVAGFSGGGYADYQPGFDWWRDRTPRLYEMMFGSAPAFNWLPKCDLPIEDWDGPEAQARFAWLKRWNIWYKAIARSEMISHEFLCARPGNYSILRPSAVTRLRYRLERRCHEAHAVGSDVEQRTEVA